ncbi:MAG: hypothetical protein FD153_480 [Rhodospirillaceae bacterium]|nr:MAG: hypothetical protein FD153_480 [Rhodospirillaceae bacterium]
MPHFEADPMHGTVGLEEMEQQMTWPFEESGQAFNIEVENDYGPRGPQKSENLVLDIARKTCAESRNAFHEDHFIVVTPGLAHFDIKPGQVP